MIAWAEVLLLILLSGTKFLVAPFVAESPPYDLEFRDAFILTTSGGIAGVITFVFFGDFVISRWSNLAYLIRSIYTSKQKLAEFKARPKRKFKRSTRFIVRVKKRFGLAGIAFVTPCIISIPIGCVVAVGFYRQKFKVLAFITVSLLLWSVVLNVLAQFFGLSKYFVN